MLTEATAALSSTVRVLQAASVVMLAPGSDGPRVYWVRRSDELRFLAGFHVFPGGRHDEVDGDLRATAIRELFEETGLLLAVGGESVPDDRRRAHREALVRDETNLAQVLDAERLEADAARLLPAGRWITPPFGGPVRFDTSFFVAAAPAEQRAEVVRGELVDGEWIDPAEALARWRDDRVMLAAPTKRVLEALAGLPPGDPHDPAWLRDAAARLAAASPDGDWGRRIELRPGLFVYPVRSPTLPPHTHTNVVVVGDGAELVVIDPGAEDPAEQAALHELLDELVDEGRRVREVVLTHLHRDHTAGAAALADRFGARIAAHPLTRDALVGDVRVDRIIESEETIDLPADRAGGSAPRRLRLIHTPGHSRGHIVLREETTGVLIAGDLVAGAGWVIVDPPEGDMAEYVRSLEGDMAEYVRSLERVAELADGAMGIPAHGPFVGDMGEHCRKYVAHRLARERKVLAALGRGAATLDEIVEGAYDDTPRAMWPLAARSAIAHLLKLVGDGAAREAAPGRWELVAPHGAD